MTEFVDAATFGRAAELAAIENALWDPARAGVVIEGDMGMGKTTLAAEVYRRGHSRKYWVRGDRVLRNVPYGAFGLHADLNEDPANLLVRAVSAIRGAGDPKVTIFVDDAHDLDEYSLNMLRQLANDGDIKLVAAVRPPVDDSVRPFSDLVADRVLEHVSLEPLQLTDFSAMVENHLGGIVPSGALDFIAFRSGRVPGKIIELLRYTSRQQRLIDRRGVWLLDGFDIGLDDRARDVTRIHLSRFSEQQRQALEFVVLAGEVEVGIMLAAGLGEAADLLVSAGEIGLVQSGPRSYAAIENHSTETIRTTVPVGRSRKMFDFVEAYDAPVSERARMLRAEWGLNCGGRVTGQDSIDAARIAVRLGEWQRALRILQGVPTDDMAAHELFDLGQLYCDVNRTPIGLDIFAQAVEKACCTSVLLEVFAVWWFRDLHLDSPPLTVSDFRTALSRLERSGPGHDDAGIAIEHAHELIEVLRADQRESLSDAAPDLIAWAADIRVPDGLRLCIGIAEAIRELELGRSSTALKALESVEELKRNVGTVSLLHGMLKARVLMQEDQADDARVVLDATISHDLAYFAARSGPADLMWTRMHIEDGDLAAATRCSFAAVEALTYWNQTPFLALALAEAEHMAVLAGDVGAADDFDARYIALPASNAYIESRRAQVLRLSARAKATGEQYYLDSLRELLAAAEDSDALQIAAMIRIEVFRHFGEYDGEAMSRLGEVGADAGRDCRLLAQLGPALRDRDKASLESVADAVAIRMPDVAERCRSIANGGEVVHSSTAITNSDPGHKAGGVSLTGRERQISRLIVDGMTNAEIADELGVAVRTVEGHTYRMYRKLSISSRDQVAEAIGGTRSNL